MRTAHLKHYTLHGFRVILLFVGTLAATRILYELFFPRLLWLARPLPALTLATIVAITIGMIWRHFSPAPLLPSAILPLLLNLLYLFNPTVNLVGSRFVFAASLWLTAVLASVEWRLAKGEDVSGKWQVVDIIFLLAALIPVYFMTMTVSVGQADTFEFQVVVPQLGIAHPTGYPLYLMLGKLFTLLPVGSVAWRLNLGTAVFALTAAIFLYLSGRKLLSRPLPALLGAVALGLTPTFWSQAIEAEVYSLHALIITAALYLMQAASGRRPKVARQVASGRSQVANERKRFIIHHSQFTIHYSLFFLIGLGLTNHLTTLFLLPPAALTLIFAYRSQTKSLIINLQSFIKLALAFILPLSLYAYLPIRWAAVNGEPMGFGRFVDWVIGGRFQGALQWRAWLVDPTRYEIVSRLFLDNWGWINLALALIGFIYLFSKRWRLALILFVTWLGYTFYNLNYYVPDLAVFLIPAQIVVAIWWMAGMTAVLQLIKPQRTQRTQSWQLSSVSFVRSVAIILFSIPILLLAIENWPQIDRSQADGLTEWGSGVLAMPLAENAAILADSEKIAPLYYLQQAENIRPDLDIMVLPDEAAYRAELDGRIAAGQTVYLARFLPGLEGIYHLRSLGPLTEVSTQPLTELPGTAVPTQLVFDDIQLIGYELEPKAAVDEMSTAVTLYWQTNNQQPATNNQLIYIRWAGTDSFSSRHPANNYYPTLAWKVGEIVPDYHLLPQPISDWEQRQSIQVALGSPFTSVAALEWQTVTTVKLLPTAKMDLERPYRLQIGPTFLDSAQFPAQIRPGQPLPITLSGYGAANALAFSLSAAQVDSSEDAQLKIVPLQLGAPFITEVELETEMENGRYQLIVSQPNTAALCGWLQPASDGCVLGQIEISGMPLPAGATNYDDKIALLNIDLPQTELQPGGQLSLTLTWQSLASMSEEYTIFLQILDAKDRIVGQVDAWPRQGTLPTSQWTTGQTINDPYLIWLDDDLPPGQYRLIIGWYLLADLRRLAVLNESGQPIDDKLLVPGLVVP